MAKIPVGLYPMQGVLNVTLRGFSIEMDTCHNERRREVVCLCDLRIEAKPTAMADKEQIIAQITAAFAAPNGVSWRLALPRQRLPLSWRMCCS